MSNSDLSGLAGYVAWKHETDSQRANGLLGTIKNLREELRRLAPSTKGYPSELMVWYQWCRHNCAGIVVNAVKRGTMSRGSCEVCSSPKAQGHHDDYSRPRSVRWLCKEHHRQWHNSNKPKFPSQPIGWTPPGWLVRKLAHHVLPTDPDRTLDL